MKRNDYERMMTDLLLIKITPVGLSFKEVIKENTEQKTRHTVSVQQIKTFKMFQRSMRCKREKNIGDYAGIILKLD